MPRRSNRWHATRLTPQFVRGLGMEVLLQRVPRDGLRRIALRRDPKAPPRTPSQPFQAHQAGNLMAPDANTLGSQFHVNARAAVDPLARLVDPPDLRHQLSVLLGSRALRPCAPGVVTACRDPQQATHHADRIAITAATDARVSHLDRLAKYAAASRKKSRSFFTWASSRFNAASSRSRGRPFPGNASLPSNSSSPRHRWNCRVLIPAHRRRLCLLYLLRSPSAGLPARTPRCSAWSASAASNDTSRRPTRLIPAVHESRA